jgi:hypothetical protein
VVQIDDLNNAWKLAIGHVPDPYDPAAEHDPEPAAGGRSSH